MVAPATTLRARYRASRRSSVPGGVQRPAVRSRVAGSHTSHPSHQSHGTRCDRWGLLCAPGGGSGHW